MCYNTSFLNVSRAAGEEYGHFLMMKVLLSAQIRNGGLKWSKNLYFYWIYECDTTFYVFSIFKYQ